MLTPPGSHADDGWSNAQSPQPELLALIEQSSKATYSCRHSPCTACNGLLASSALPHTHHSTLNCVLAAECADISRVLCNFHLLHILTERCTVTGTVLSGDADLSGTLCHCLYLYVAVSRVFLSKAQKRYSTVTVSPKQSTKKASSR
jgi:hypothetical protein